MSFTHWYDEPPFRNPRYDSPLFDYDIPAIIREVEKRGETKKAKIETSEGIESEWSCGNCQNELSHTEIDGSYCLWCGAEFE